MIVPNPLLKGIFSYLLKTVALKTSPDLGIAKLERYDMNTDKIRFTVFGL